MKAFDELVDVARTLNGPNGCPWDLRQTFFSLQPYVLEEAHELVEAVDGQKNEEIIEELGDLLYTVIFYAKVAEKEGLFSLDDILVTIKEKLIRRHPHVFGSIKAETEEEVIKNWESIKKNEEGKNTRKSLLDGIPDQLSLLAKAQKMVRVFQRNGFIDLSKAEEKEDLSLELFRLIQKAEKLSIDLESSFRRFLSEKKKNFMEFESSKV
jgi:tetrapyrrole methylase family protein/MazG family protein